MTDSTQSQPKQAILHANIADGWRCLRRQLNHPINLMVRRAVAEPSHRIGLEPFQYGLNYLHGRMPNYSAAYDYFAAAYTASPRGCGNVVAIASACKMAETVLYVHNTARRFTAETGGVAAGTHNPEHFKETRARLYAELNAAFLCEDTLAQLCLIRALIQLNLGMGRIGDAEHHASRYNELVKEQPLLRRFRLHVEVQHFLYVTDSSRIAVATRAARQPKHDLGFDDIA